MSIRCVGLNLLCTEVFGMGFCMGFVIVPETIRDINSLRMTGVQ